jgi:hypothetical protein
MINTVDAARKNIAVVDWKWQGHHPSYFLHFALAMASENIRVIPFCPNPEDFSSRLLALVPDAKRRTNLDVATPVRFHKPSPSNLWPMRFRGKHDATRLFGYLELILRIWEVRNQSKIDSVFFACIYDFDFFDFPAASLVFRRRWSGLYLLSFGFRKTTSVHYDWIRVNARPERFLKSSRLLALATLDEGIVNQINEQIGEKRCILFPDFTEEQHADTRPDTLGGIIRTLAAERPVITLVGTLYEQRGLNLFLKTALENPQWFFALVGEVSGISAKTQCLLAKFTRLHCNSFFYPHRVPTDEVYNGVIATADIIWNIHLDWPGSSNTLTKAAVFEKPVIVSNRHLVGERVRKFHLGETCDEDSSSSVQHAIARIVENQCSHDSWISRNKPKWSEFRQLHSLQRLQSAMKQFVELL